MSNSAHPWRKLLSAAVLTLVVGMLVAACGGDDGGDEGAAEGESASGELTKVTIGTQPWIGYGPLWIATEQGFDEKHGVDIELVNFTTDQDLESGFASDRFEAANAANNQWIRAADLGIDFTIVLMEDFSLQADAIVSCNPDVRSVEDLAGKEGLSVAFEEFSVSDVLFRYALKEAGDVDFEQFDYSPIPAADAGTAAVAGRVDVAVTYEPYLQAALKEGDNCEVIYTANERPGLISDTLAFNREWAEENPEAVVGVLRAWDEAVDFYNQNTKEGQAIIAENVGEKPAALRPSFAGVQLFDLEQSQEFLTSEFADLWGDIGEILVEQGQIKSVPDVNDYYDTSFGEQALGSGNGE